MINAIRFFFTYLVPGIRKECFFKSFRFCLLLNCLRRTLSDNLTVINNCYVVSDFIASSI